MRTALLLKVLLTAVTGFLSFSVFFGNANKHQEPKYTSELIKMYDQPEQECLAMQLSIYGTYANGQVLLKHSAIIKSGIGCSGEPAVLNRKTYSEKSGPEYIVKDEQLNGPIEKFITDHEKLYQDIIVQKEKLMGI